MSLSHDPHWLRAGVWLESGDPQAELDVALLGVPAHETSLSPTSAHQTPDAIRAALHRYSTYAVTDDVDLRSLRVADLGSVLLPDGEEGQQRVHDDVRLALLQAKLLIALGGDNSITYPVARGADADAVITFDAHHDVREGASNGSPIRQLIESGVSGRRIVQIGIADFANSHHYSQWTREQGVRIFSRNDVAERGMQAVVSEALAHISGAARIHLDVDVDVCDRAIAPACPASLPGGLSAHELLAGVTQVVSDRRVISVDVTEVDAAADTPDQRTIRLGALIVLRALLGYARRR